MEIDYGHMGFFFYDNPNAEIKEGIMEKWHYKEKSERLRIAEDRVHKRMCSPRAQINRRLRDDIVGFLSDRRFQRNRERMH